MTRNMLMYLNYEHCKSCLAVRDSGDMLEVVGDAFIDGLTRYTILGIVRYSTTSPKVNESWEDIKPPGRTSLKELMSGGINDCPTDDGFVTSVKGLFHNQRLKAKAFVHKTMKGEEENEAQEDWSENDVEISPFARQLTLIKAK
ncbi:hypersensitive to pi starvation 4 [Trifolium pratense]|uniref:Hypersensitive to pi starvation 4 n=1 Tax=Trifolium pratense TaxID=57577 RepID=A0A2K3LWX6_TRIPR|nr:hypersensitive to pi starvation 4 [Trifolium pratense]